MHSYIISETHLIVNSIEMCNSSLTLSNLLVATGKVCWGKDVVK